MNTFAMKDVKALAAEVALYYNDEDTSTWFEIIDKIKKEFPDIKETILEFLGPSVFAFTREYSKKIGLPDLIFETPVKMMPVYIESKNAWEVVVARWRLTINK